MSQTSGRYVSTENIDFVHDPILDEVLPEIEDCIQHIENTVEKIKEKTLNKAKNFSDKKKITSAIRRLLPNGQSNEIGFSMNIRSLRHILKLRTNSHAEWEIRYVFCQIFNIINSKWPTIFYGLQITDTNDGLFEVF